MVELLRSNDPVRLSWVTALLADAQIETVVFDTHTSILEGLSLIHISEPTRPY